MPVSSAFRTARSSGDGSSSMAAAGRHVVRLVVAAPANSGPANSGGAASDGAGAGSRRTAGGRAAAGRSGSRPPGLGGDVAAGHALDRRVQAEVSAQHALENGVVAAHAEALHFPVPREPQGEDPVLEGEHARVGEQHPGHLALLLDRVQDRGPALPQRVDRGGRRSRRTGGAGAAG